MTLGFQLVLIAALITPRASSAAETSAWKPSYGRLAVTHHLAVHCRGAEEADDCAKAIERHQASQGRFTRKGDLLTVPVPGGKPVELRDAPKEKVGTSPNGEVSRYGYIEFLPSLGQHLVHVSGYEGTEFLLIDAKTGSKARLFGLPVPSPDGRRVACRWGNLALSLAVEVWTRTPSGFEREWSHGTTFIPGVPEWLSAVAFRVERGGEGETGSVTFTKTGSSWVEKAGP